MQKRPSSPLLATTNLTVLCRVGWTKRTIHRQPTKKRALFYSEYTPIHDLVGNGDNNRGDPRLDQVSAHLGRLAVDEDEGFNPYSDNRKDPPFCCDSDRLINRMFGGGRFDDRFGFCR